MSKNEKLSAVIQHAYKNAPAVTKRFDEAGIDPTAIKSIADLNRVPILKKDEVAALQQADPPFGGMLAVPMSEVRHIFFSPGPIYEADAGDVTEALEVAAYLLRKAGFNEDDVIMNTLSYHLVPAGLLVDWALNHMGATVVPAGVGNSELQLKIMQDVKATAYAGTPSFLMALIKKAEGMGLNFRETFSITKGIFTAEPLSGAMRNTFENEYGISVCNAYGTAEFGFLAYSTDNPMAMTLLPDPIIQVVDPDTGLDVGSGEVGEVVVTNFNMAYPLIRYGTGDAAVFMAANGLDTPQEERQIVLVGRTGEAIKVRGMLVHPNQLRFAAGQVAGMMGAEMTGIQGVVTRPEERDYFVVRVALKAEAPAGMNGALKQAIQQACRVKVDEIAFVDEISADARGMLDERSWD